jgi:hypothetical protein
VRRRISANLLAIRLLSWNGHPRPIIARSPGEASCRLMLPLRRYRRRRPGFCTARRPAPSRGHRVRRLFKIRQWMKRALSGRAARSGANPSS